MIDSCLDAATANTIAHLLMAGIRREYPNKPGTTVAGPTGLRSPREQTPMFYGCFDWHSAVHSHWALVRLLSQADAGTHAWAGAVRTQLDTSFSEQRARGELAYLQRPEHRGFEMPYGIAWLLQLCAELRSAAADDEQIERWQQTLEPLEHLAAQRFCAWLELLPCAIRCGQHSQSAFAMALVRDWAKTANRASVISLVDARSMQFYGADCDGPMPYEPSAYDFLSPCLAEADLMRRIMSADNFSNWLDEFIPGFDTLSMQPVVASDRSDGKLAHFDGLNASRAWMFAGIASAIADGDARGAHAAGLAKRHGDAAMAALQHDDYAVTHWVGSFVVYYLTAAQVRPPTARKT